MTTTAHPLHWSEEDLRQTPGRARPATAPPSHRKARRIDA